jgi:hypothetical protein
MQSLPALLTRINFLLLLISSIWLCWIGKSILILAPILPLASRWTTCRSGLGAFDILVADADSRGVTRTSASAKCSSSLLRGCWGSRDGDDVELSGEDMLVLIDGPRNCRIAGLVNGFSVSAESWHSGERDVCFIYIIYLLECQE